MLDNKPPDCYTSSMQISLSESLSQLVQAKVGQAGYNAPEEVVGDALRYFLDDSSPSAHSDEEMLTIAKSRLAMALEDPSRLIDGEEVFAELDRVIDNA
jgi:metal-responsive CopG/Arc/MetJ family transcriptional regulator